MLGGIIAFSLTDENVKQEPGVNLSYLLTLQPCHARMKILHSGSAEEAGAGVGDVRTSACVETVRGSDRWATAL